MQTLTAPNTARFNALAPVAPTAPAPTPPAPKIARLTLGGVPKKTDSTKTAYPVFPDGNGEAALIGARIIERTGQLEALEGALETDKKELRTMVSPHYFTVNHGRHEVPSSIAVPTAKGEVLVTFQNRYPALPNEDALVPILGEHTTATWFRQSMSVKIDADKLPETTAQELLNKVVALFTEYGATDALEVKESIKPLKEFHAARHLQLTPEQNFQLDQACPIVAMIKTKGRK